MIHQRFRTGSSFFWDLLNILKIFFFPLPRSKASQVVNMAPPDDYIRRDTQWAIGATLLGQKDFGFEANQNGSKVIFDSRTLLLHVGETYIFFSGFFFGG